PVRVAVADDFLRGGVPANRTADTYGNVAQVTHRRRPVPDLDVADRLLTRLDAAEPVVPVLGAHLQPYVLRGERLLDQLRRSRLQLAAVDVDAPLLALEGEPLLVIRAAPQVDRRAAGVVVDDVEPLGRLV